ncbi:glycosyltransferase family 2 protein [Yoonia sp.]|uniref:glycosyltransferase family 2 protein n=1 Tax=Yoonia sp. TaxID=2212373 RepID=UPI002E07BF34|nr:glycosyltransferase family 2 protein [Yoonia sp.]
MASKPPKQRIVIGICTRQRNALLRRLLESIWEQPIPPNYDVDVVIVDNNDEPAVTLEILQLPEKFNVTLVHESKVGLVNARNRILDAATLAGADWLIGVDDDEWVAPDWLAQFIIAFETLDAAIIVAAKQIIYDEATSPFVERRQIEDLPPGSDTRIFSTANFAISKCVFDPDHGPGLRFAMGFNESGGEDYEFMLRAKNLYGLRAKYWPHAVATEEVNGKRTTFSHHFKRRIAAQVTRYHAMALHSKASPDESSSLTPLNLLLRSNRAIVYGTGWCLVGIGLLLLGRRNAREVIGKGMFSLARGYAIIPYLLGRRTVLYGADVNADRSAST